MLMQMVQDCRCETGQIFVESQAGEKTEMYGKYV